MSETDRVARLKGKLPGIYMIQTDEFGDRRFFHWRDSSAARSLMDLPETDDILDSLANYDVVYLSAIPTGGIGEANAAAWLSEPNVVAVGGSWLCPAADIRSGNRAGISAICHRTMKSLKPA